MCLNQKKNMKNVSLSLNIVLLIAVAVLYYLHFSAKKPEQIKAPVKSSVGISGESIAYVNTDSLLRNYTLYSEKRELLQKKQMEVESRLYKEQAGFERKVADFQQKVAKHLITRREAEDWEKRLAKQQENLMKLKNSLTNELMLAEQTITKDLQDSIVSFLKSYNKGINYSYIISSSGGILYGDENLDITNVVIKGLNDRYAGKKEVKEEKKKEAEK